MTVDKNVPPYVAHFDGNQVPTVMGVEGTLGTADAGGTARPLPIGVNPVNGAMYVQDLSGAAGTTNVVIVGGTLNAGTITTTLALDSGTISTIAAGTLNTLGTVGTVIGVGTVTNLGSVTNIGNSGTTTGVGVVSNLTNGSVNILTGTVQSSGTTTGVGTITNLGSVTNVGNSGTTTGVGVVTSVTNLVSGTLLNSGTATGVGVVTTVSNVTNGTVRISVGTITTGSITDLANLYSGSVRMTVGTITTGSITNVANVLSITAGTQNTLGTVGVVNNIVTGTLASVRIDNRPTGSSVITSHTLGTGGGTLFGTILAPSGAGTSVYIAGLSIVGRSGTVDCGISNNVAGSTGAGVLARGFFQPGGGIARDFNPAINLGTNGTITYFLITAGTVDLTVNYWVAP